MRSTYKRIGQFVRQVNKRNNDLAVINLKGISINKLFMPSVANINGTDLSNYKVVSKYQFAYNPMHVGRDEVLPIGMLEDDESIIVSPAYVVFEIIDSEQLLPEYLMMWCRRSEFDRNCWFTTDSSVRGGFNWDDFCNMTLPVPSIDKQCEIVREYNTIVERIKLNEQLIQKLEETAQALYKQWFVDFEFPISKQYAETLGRPELEGVSFKSGYGNMCFNQALDINIPEIFKLVTLHDVVSKFLSNRGKSKLLMNLQEKSKLFNYPVISAMNVNSGAIVKENTIPYVDENDFRDWTTESLESGDVIMTSEAPLGEVYFVALKTNFVLSQRLFGLKTMKNKLPGSYLYYWLQSSLFKKDLEGRASGTTAQGIRLSELKKCHIIQPDNVSLVAFDSLVIKILQYKEILREQNSVLRSLIYIMYSKMVLSR
jgi:type I restriction enzyme S subunit